MPYRAIVAVLACAALTGCGSDSEPDSGADTTTVTDSTTTTIVVDTPESSPPTDAPTTVPASTTTTSTTTTSTTTTTSPPTTVPGAEACLEGSWALSSEGVAALYSNLLPGFPVEVTGSHFVTFAGATVDFWTLLEIRFLAGGTDVTFGLDQHGVGTYSIADSAALFTYDTFEQRLHEGHGSADSNPSNDPAVHADEYVDLADNGNGTITIDRVTLPVPDLPPFAGGPIGCSGDEMSLGYTSGLAETAAVYVRVS